MIVQSKLFVAMQSGDPNNVMYMSQVLYMRFLNKYTSFGTKITQLFPHASFLAHLRASVCTMHILYRSAQNWPQNLHFDL